MIEGEYLGRGKIYSTIDLDHVFDNFQFVITLRRDIACQVVDPYEVYISTTYTTFHTTQNLLFFEHNILVITSLTFAEISSRKVN